MRYPVNLDLFVESRRSPSVFELAASMNAEPGTLRDYSLPMNSYFPTTEVLGNLQSRLEAALKLYPGSNRQVASRLADFVGLDAATMVVGSGSTELITWISRLLVEEALALPIPTVGRWLNEPRRAGKTVHTFLRRAERDFQISPGELVGGILEKGARAAVLTNPNNPTGALMSRADVLSVLDALRDLDVVVVDESFIDFATEGGVPSVESDVSRFPNALVVKSLGQSLGLPGLHLGYAVGNPSLVARLRDALPTGNVNGLALALIDELPGARQRYEEGRRRVVRDRVYLEQKLRVIPGLKVFPSHANFVYTRLPEGVDGVRLRNHMLGEHGCLLRACGDKEGSDSRYLRVAARPAGEVNFLVEHWVMAAAELAQAPGKLPARRQSRPASTARSSFKNTFADPEPTPTPSLATSAALVALVQAGVLAVEAAAASDDGIEAWTPRPDSEDDEDSEDDDAATIATEPAPALARALELAQQLALTQQHQTTGAGPASGAIPSPAVTLAPRLAPVAPVPLFDVPTTGTTMTMTTTSRRRRQVAILGAAAIVGLALAAFLFLRAHRKVDADAASGTTAHEVDHGPPRAASAISNPLPASKAGPSAPGEVPAEPADLADLPEIPPLGGPLAESADTGLAGAGESAAALRKSKRKAKRRLARLRHRASRADEDVRPGQPE